MESVSTFVYVWVCVDVDVLTRLVVIILLIVNIELDLNGELGIGFVCVGICKLFFPQSTMAEVPSSCRTNYFIGENGG